ncbi:MAG: family 16 glycosylhydrolase [Chitinispirillaceae bacterium]
MKCGKLYAIIFTAVLTAFAAQAPNGETYIDEPFFDDFEESSVDNGTWLVATWEEHGGQTGKERCFVENGKLHMQFINSSTEGYLSSAIQTRDEYFYGRWEMRAKPSEVPGVLNSFYTIDWDNTADNGSTSDGTKQEIDIEFLTKSFGDSKGEIHFALHAEGKESWDTRPDISLWFDPSEDFHVYGFEITPDYVEWFVDDSVLYRYEYEKSDISITAPYAIKLNTWSAVKWIGGPPEEDVVCEYQIDWIRFTPHQTTAVKKNGLQSRVFRDVSIKNGFLILSPDFSTPREFRIFDAAGRLVSSENFSASIGSYDLKSSQLNSGVHFYTVRTGSRLFSGKVTIVK